MEAVNEGTSRLTLGLPSMGFARDYFVSLVEKLNPRPWMTDTDSRSMYECFNPIRIGKIEHAV
jgi:hypothetical protein